MPEEMFDEGYTNITNIDYSKNLIVKMQEKYQDKGPNFKCKYNIELSNKDRLSYGYEIYGV